jgi:hypothetical protein
MIQRTERCKYGITCEDSARVFAGRVDVLDVTRGDGVEEFDGGGERRMVEMCPWRRGRMH